MCSSTLIEDPESFDVSVSDGDVFGAESGCNELRSFARFLAFLLFFFFLGADCDFNFDIALIRAARLEVSWENTMIVFECLV